MTFRDRPIAVWGLPLVTLLIALTVLGTDSGGVATRLRGYLFDSLIASHPRVYEDTRAVAGHPVRVLEIDAPSIERFGPWPWPSGTTAGLLTLSLTVAEDKGGWLGNLHTFRSTMAQNFWIAMVSFGVCFVVTVLLSVVGKAKPAADLKGLVWGATDMPKTGDEPWHKRPVPLAVAAAVVCIAINIWLW